MFSFPYFILLAARTITKDISREQEQLSTVKLLTFLNIVKFPLSTLKTTYFRHEFYNNILPAFLPVNSAFNRTKYFHFVL